MIELPAVALLLDAGGRLDQFHHDGCVLDLALERHQPRNRLLQAVELRDVFLGALAVVPKRRHPHLGLHGLDFALLLLDVKETSIGGPRVS